MPFSPPTDWWLGTLLSWRWIDQEQGLWCGQVRYTDGMLTYEHSVSGELIQILD